jgi:hypothetical protein
MELVDRVRAEAHQVAEVTSNESAQEVGLLGDAISVFAEAFTVANDLAKTEAATVRKALLSHNFNTLNLAFDAALRGYYIQSIALLRNVYENWLAFWYVAKYQDDAHFWLNPSWEQRPPKAEVMLNKIEHESKDDKTKIRGFHSELARFDHTDPVAVLSRIKITENQALIFVGVRYDKVEFETCTYALCLWLGNTLDMIASTVPQEEKWHKRHAAIGERLLAYIENDNARRGANEAD